MSTAGHYARTIYGLRLTRGRRALHANITASPATCMHVVKSFPTANASAVHCLAVASMYDHPLSAPTLIAHEVRLLLTGTNNLNATNPKMNELLRGVIKRNHVQVSWNLAPSHQSNEMEI